MDVRVGLWRKLSTEKSMLLSCGVESPLDCKEIQPVHLEGDQSWGLIRRTDAEAETPIFWPPHVKSWLIGKYLMLGGIEGRKRRGQQRMRCLDGITDSMDISLSRLWELWWTGRPGVLQFMGSQRVRHDWVPELNWTELKQNPLLYLEKPKLLDFKNNLIS